MSSEKSGNDQDSAAQGRQVTLTVNCTRLIPLIDSLRVPIVTLRNERLKIGIDLLDVLGNQPTPEQQGRIKAINADLRGLEQELCVLLENFYMNLRQDMGEPQPWPRDDRGDPGKAH